MNQGDRVVTDLGWGRLDIGLTPTNFEKLCLGSADRESDDPTTRPWVPRTDAAAGSEVVNIAFTPNNVPEMTYLTCGTFVNKIHQ